MSRTAAGDSRTGDRMRDPRPITTEVHLSTPKRLPRRRKRRHEIILGNHEGTKTVTYHYGQPYLQETA